jgi:hypothetical protein
MVCIDPAGTPVLPGRSGRFRQGLERNRQRRAGGVGLGLYIARQPARSRDGDLLLAYLRRRPTGPASSCPCPGWRRPLAPGLAHPRAVRDWAF